MNIDPNELDEIFKTLGVPHLKAPFMTVFALVAARQLDDKARHDEHVAAIKSATFELELIRTALQDVAKAINMYTHESLHTVR